MSAALPHADPADPRLGPLVRAALRRERLDAGWERTITDLATGASSPRALRCCGSGCRPCVQDLLRCTVTVLKAARDPAAERELMRPPGLRQRVRGLAGRAAKRLLAAPFGA